MTEPQDSFIFLRARLNVSVLSALTRRFHAKRAEHLYEAGVRARVCVCVYRPGMICVDAEQTNRNCVFVFEAATRRQRTCACDEIKSAHVGVHARVTRRRAA